MITSPATKAGKQVKFCSATRHAGLSHYFALANFLVSLIPLHH